jgi:hypothetical protein
LRLSRIVAQILALATLPTRIEIAADRFRQAQLRAALETLRVGFETRRSYYRAIRRSVCTSRLNEKAGIIAANNAISLS